MQVLLLDPIHELEVSLATADKIAQQILSQSPTSPQLNHQLFLASLTRHGGYATFDCLDQSPCRLIPGLEDLCIVKSRIAELKKSTMTGETGGDTIHTIQEAVQGGL